MTTKRTPMKCPHCGKVYKNLRSSLIPYHNDDSVVVLSSEMSAAALESGATEELPICPGSGQYPRNADSDKRPLWKDERKQEP